MATDRLKWNETHEKKATQKCDKYEISSQVVSLQPKRKGPQIHSALKGEQKFNSDTYQKTQFQTKKKHIIMNCDQKNASN